jgi:hypothetical protein
MHSTYESSSKCNILHLIKIVFAFVDIDFFFFQVFSADETYTKILIKNQVREFTKV